jgi:glutamine amidotransferase
MNIQIIIIVDYGMGNLSSVQRKFSKMGIETTITNDIKQIRKADKLILPGVGHFKKAVENLKSLGLWDVLNESVLIKKIPVMGICLGMQLMAKRSEEGYTDGLGWLNADIVRFQVADALKHKVPHIGWNTIQQAKSSILLNNVSPDAEYYFVHSYHAKANNPSEVLSYSNYEYEFVSAMEKDNIFGFQFHPEKSHSIGEQLLLNFSRL